MNRKLVVFVPRRRSSAVREAIFAAGGGADRRLRALLVVQPRASAPSSAAPGTEPDVGERGVEERVAELRLETVFPAERQAELVAALRDGASLRGAGLRHLPARVSARLFTDGGARGNPGPAAYAYVLEAEDGTVLAAHGETIGVATNNVAEYGGLVAGLAKAIELRAERARGRLRLGADGEADARRVPGQERGAARALAAGREARAPAREGRVPARAARAERARRPARERGARRGGHGGGARPRDRAPARARRRGGAGRGRGPAARRAWSRRSSPATSRSSRRSRSSPGRSRPSTRSRRRGSWPGELVLLAAACGLWWRRGRPRLPNSRRPRRRARAATATRVTLLFLPCSPARSATSCSSR